mgnify:CR=1 FL=1
MASVKKARNVSFNSSGDLIYLFFKGPDGNNYFLIYFNSDYGSDDSADYFWTFGEPLFKKYNLIFTYFKNSIILLYVSFRIQSYKTYNYEEITIWLRI